MRYLTIWVFETIVNMVDYNMLVQRWEKNFMEMINNLDWERVTLLKGGVFPRLGGYWVMRGKRFNGLGCSIF